MSLYHNHFLTTGVDEFEPSLGNPPADNMYLTSTTYGRRYWSPPSVSFIKQITRLSDFPDPIAGVIYLGANITYMITTHIDLGANVLDCSGGTVGLVGNGSELSSLTTSSVGDMITSNETLTIRFLSFYCPNGTVLNMDGVASTNPNPGIDWFGINFVNCPTVGTIKDYSNFVGFSLGFFNSGNLTFDGSLGTIA